MRYLIIELPPLPDSSLSRAKLHFLNPTQISHYKPKSCKSFLNTFLLRSPQVPLVCAFSLTEMNKEPNLFNYRCAPSGLWLEGIDTGHLKQFCLKSFFIRCSLKICEYVLDSFLELPVYNYGYNYG